MQIHVLQCLILGYWNGLDLLEYQDCGESMRWWVILQLCVIIFSVSGQANVTFAIYLTEFQIQRYVWCGGCLSLKSAGFSRATFVFSPQNETWERTNGKKEPLET